MKQWAWMPTTFSPCCPHRVQFATLLASSYQVFHLKICRATKANNANCWLLVFSIEFKLGYLVVFGGGLLLSLWAIVGPVLQVTADVPFIGDAGGGRAEVFLDGAAIPFVMILGVVAVPILFRLARFVSRLHARYAKWMLVGSLHTGSDG